MNNRYKWLAGALALAGLAFGIAPVAAQDEIIDWGPNCFGWEPGYAAHVSTFGDTMTIVGKIDAFLAPFDDLDPGTVEYTFIMGGLVSQGTNVIAGMFYETDYAGGYYEIYADAVGDFDFGTNPANATSPSTFVNGIMILSGSITGFSTTVIDNGLPPGATGNMSGTCSFTGGTLVDRVDGCTGGMLGTWLDDPAVVSIPAGYSIHFDGKIDADCPTAADEESWGEVKGLFR